MCQKEKGEGGARDDGLKVFGELDNDFFAVLVTLREYCIKHVGLEEGENSKSGAGEGEEAADVLEHALAKTGVELERRCWKRFLFDLGGVSVIDAILTNCH